jgi:predicted GIY-YIG superfamily endonuclease
MSWPERRIVYVLQSDLEPDRHYVGVTSNLARRLEAHNAGQKVAGFEKCSCILAPCCLVEIDRQEEARLVSEQRIHASDEGLALIVAAGQVPADHLISDGKESTMRTLRALDAGLFADPAHPLIGARRRIAGLAGLSALESARVDVVTAAEQ